MAVKSLLKKKVNSSSSKKNRKSLIKDLNRLYKEHKPKFVASNDLYTIDLVDKKGKTSKPVCNFFFYPMQDVFSFDGNVKKQTGYKVCFIKLEEDELGGDEKKTKKVKLELSIEMLTSGEWIENDALEGFDFYDKKYIEKLMTITLDLPNKEDKIKTSLPGWIEGEDSIHYIPITDFKEDGIRCKKNILNTYKLDYSKYYNEKETFSKMNDLVDVTDKKITIQLLSFTVLSSILSLIDMNNYESPKFMLSLYGEGRDKVALSNLFCNIYNRSHHIYELNSKLHDYKTLKTKIPEKLSKLRDAIFIGKIENQKDVKFYNKLFEQERQSGLLLLSKDLIDLHSVVNIDVRKVSIKQYILIQHKSNPHIFTDWFVSFIKYIHSTLIDTDCGLGKLEYLDKLYRSCIKEIEQYGEKNKTHTEINPNLLEHYGWLLLGYKLFINYGWKIGAISEDEFSQSNDSSVKIFHEICSLKLYDEKANADQENITIEEDAIQFLNALNYIIKDGDLLPFIKPLKEPEWGWFEGDLIRLKNKKLYGEVSKYLKRKQYKFSVNSDNLYDFLLNKEIITERPTSGSGYAFQETSATKAIRYSESKMKQFLVNHGYELTFYDSNK